MKKILSAMIMISVLCSFNTKTTLRGVWEYAGDIYNGKKQKASASYILQRRYDAEQYEAFFIEPGEKPALYEKGNYTLKLDTCTETQTYSRQPSKLMGIGIKYIYQIKNDTLTLSGTLPDGAVVQEYWKRAK